MVIRPLGGDVVGAAARERLPGFKKWSPSPYDAPAVGPATPPMRETGPAATLVPSEPEGAPELVSDDRAAHVVPIATMVPSSARTAARRPSAAAASAK
jgi:hypothetical protein